MVSINDGAREDTAGCRRSKCGVPLAMVLVFCAVLGTGFGIGRWWERSLNQQQIEALKAEAILEATATAAKHRSKRFES